MVMNKKQYNHVIDWTLKHEASAQTDDSLATARAIFDNMGVALPQGDMKTVYETIKAENYMGWKSCTMQEAQEAANNGTAAIGISEDKIIVLSATDEEEPVAQTASVMTLDENTSAYAVDGLRYYAYNGGTTGTTEHRIFNSNYLINQVNTNIVYPSGEKPGTENRAFYDPLFYRTVCGKSGATGTIKEFGCGICCLAMYALYKSGQINTNVNQYNAVKAATLYGTDNAADLKSSATYSFDGESITMAETNSPDSELSSGNCCIFYIAGKHFVLVYGIDYSKTGTDKYLVADPDGGQLRTLTAAMTRRKVSANMSNITSKRVVR